MDEIEKLKTLPGKSSSLWMDTAGQTDYPFMPDKIAVDVAILGGGITGIVSAFLLKQAGLKVAVVEAERIVSDVTGHTTAKVTSAHGLIYDYLISTFGEEKARQYADANQAAIEKIAELVKEENLDCYFDRMDAYTFSQREEDVESLKKEAEAASRLGITASFVEKVDIPIKISGAVKFENQALFHPRKFLLALAEKIDGGGSYIFENTRALDVDEDDEGCEVETTRGEIKAKHVIMATHYPFLDKGLYFARLHPRTSYALGVRIKGPNPNGLFYQIHEPNLSIRPYPMKDGDMLVVGGIEHKTGLMEDTAQAYKTVEKLAREHFDVESVDYHWSTQDNETLDRVPYIGKFLPTSKRLYVATGFGGWGMTHGVVSAMILTDLITNQENPWAEVFDPNRFDVSASAKNLAMENFQVAKNFIGDRIKAKTSEGDMEQIQKGEGKIVRVKGEDIAVYKDEKGKIHSHSPKCTHMGCYVHWNNAERSWDCPCHGSRFKYDGKVIHGPALEDLEKKDIPKN